MENISSRSSEGSDEEYGSPVNRQSSAAYPNRLNYIALNLLDNRGVQKCEDLAGFKPTSCKGGINGLHSSPYVCLGFKEGATTAKGKMSDTKEHIFKVSALQFFFVCFFKGVEWIFTKTPSRFKFKLTFKNEGGGASGAFTCSS